jgi:hypothetical protein
VLSQLNNLNRRLIARLDSRACRKRHLRQAHSSRIRIVRRSQKHKRLEHDVRHVWRTTVGSVGAVSEVDLELGLQVAAEPAWLEGDGAAGGGPVCAVVGGS